MLAVCISDTFKKANPIANEITIYAFDAFPLDHFHTRISLLVITRTVLILPEIKLHCLRDCLRFWISMNASHMFPLKWQSLHSLFFWVMSRSLLIENHPSRTFSVWKVKILHRSVHTQLLNLV